MRYVIFLVLLLILSTTCNAEFTQFDFHLGRYLVEDKKEFKVYFDYSLVNYSKDVFRVRPFVGNGFVEIFNPDLNKWILPSFALSELPSITEEMIVRVGGLSVVQSQMYFEIFNTLTGEIFKTPSKKIWSGAVYSKFLENVNETMEKEQLLREERLSEPVEYIDSVELEKKPNWDIMGKIENLPGVYTAVFALLLFLTSFLFGFLKTFRSKNSRKMLDIKSRVYGVGGKIP